MIDLEFYYNNIQLIFEKLCIKNEVKYEKRERELEDNHKWIVVDGLFMFGLSFDEINYSIIMTIYTTEDLYNEEFFGPIYHPCKDNFVIDVLYHFRLCLTGYKKSSFQPKAFQSSKHVIDKTNYLLKLIYNE